MSGEESAGNRPAADAIVNEHYAKHKKGEWLRNEIDGALTWHGGVQYRRGQADMREECARLMDEFAYDDDNRFAFKLLVCMAESIRAGRHIDQYEEAATIIQNRKAIGAVCTLCGDSVNPPNAHGDCKREGCPPPSDWHPSELYGAEYQHAKQAEANKAGRRLAARERETWGNVMWRHIRNGTPREEAAYRADEWEKRRKRRG